MSQLEIPTRIQLVDTSPIVVGGPSQVNRELQVKGGKGPYEFAILGDSKSIKLTGTNLSISGKKQLALCKKLIKEPLQRPGQEGRAKSLFDEYQHKVQGTSQKLFGQSNKSLIPFRSQVRIRVVDSESQATEITIPIIFGLEQAEFATIFEQHESNREKMFAAQKARQARIEMQRSNSSDPRQRGQNSDASEIKQLRERVELLESRLDLLRRQLSELLKQTDKDSGKRRN